LLLFTERRIGKPPTAVALADLDASLVLAFLDHLEAERGNSARTRNARLTAIRSFLGYAARHDLSALAIIQQTLAIPVKRFDRPMLGFLSREDMHAVLNAADTRNWVGQRDRALLTTLYNTGARVSELIGVKISDLVLDGAPCVHLHGKGRKQRTVPLWRTTAALLRAWMRQLENSTTCSPLFPNRGGKPMTRSNVTQRLGICVQRAATDRPQLQGRGISPHTIRHTTAMHLLQSGVDITVIALWLGHENPATTHMYIEADLAMKERALGCLQPLETAAQRYRPPDELMRFLESL
jgi:site-specific recombinase XerD